MDWARRAPIVILAILLLAIALRAWGIGAESYWLDEAISVSQAQGTFSTTVRMIQGDVHLPLYTVLLYGWMKVFGTSETASRSLSLLFGAASVLLVYLLGKRMFSERTGRIAAAIACLSPMMIYYSQETRMYSLLVLLALASFYSFIIYLERGTRGTLLAYGACTLLLMYTHLFGFLVLVVQNAYIAYERRSRLRSLRDWAVMQCALAILFLPWVPTLLTQMGRTANIGWIPVPHVSSVVDTVIGFAGNPLNAAVFATVFVAYAAGIVSHNTHRRRRGDTIGRRTASGRRTRTRGALPQDGMRLLLLWMITPFLIVVTYSLAVSPLYHSRYLLFVAPASYLLFAAIMAQISEKRPRVAWTIVAVVLASSAFSAALQATTTDKDDWRSATEYLQRNVGADDTVFIDPFYQQEPFSYYYSPECFNRTNIYSCNFAEHNALSLNWQARCCDDASRLTATYDGTAIQEDLPPNELRQYTTGRVWLVSVRPQMHDRGASLQDYLRERKTITLTERIGDIEIYRFE